jgi:hypothetical protein
MIVTMATFSETGTELDQGVRHVRKEVVPSIRGAKGLRAGYWLIDREHGKRLSIMVWDDMGAMSAAMPAIMTSIRQLRQQGGLQQPQRSPDSSQRFEVIAHL